MKIYVVEGATGEYSDHQEWPVFWFSDEKEAQACVEFLSALSRELRVSSEVAYGELAEGEKLEQAKQLMRNFDPDFRMDYTGTNYRGYSIDEGSKYSDMKLTKEKLAMLLNASKEIQ